MMKARVLLALLMVGLMAATAQADLRAYWAFEEPSGDIAYDSSGNLNHGLLYADTEAGSVDEGTYQTLTGTTPPDRVAGVGGVGGALEFCLGENNYNSVLVQKSDSLRNLGSTWSMALWLRQESRDVTPGGGSGYPRVISCPNYELELGVPSWEYDYFWPYGTPGMQTDIGPTYISLGGGLSQWYHMAITYDGTDLKKYLNGTLVDSKTKPGGITDIWKDGWADAFLKLGTQTWPNKDWFVGAMDEVCIWGDEYLSQEDVTALVNGSYPLPTPTVPEPGTVALLLCGALSCLLLRRR